MVALQLLSQSINDHKFKGLNQATADTEGKLQKDKRSINFIGQWW